MKKFLAAASLVALLPLTGVAHADPLGTGYYVGAQAGFSNPGNINTRNIINPAAQEEMEFSNGYAFSLMGGYRFASNFRTELEVARRTYDANRIMDDSGVFGPFNMSGDATITTVGANIFYDFNVNDIIIPYVGIGGGMSKFEVGVSRAGAGASNVWRAEDDALYYQGMFGVAVPLQNIELFGEYRYNSTYRMDAQSNFGAFTPDHNTEDFNNSTLSIGARFHF